MNDPDSTPSSSLSPSRVTLTRLMRASGHDGMLLMRTSGDGETARDLSQPEGATMATPAPAPTYMEVQITGIRKHSVECITEQDDGAMCGARSACWDNPMQANAWIRAHAGEKGHTKFVKLMEEPVNAFSKSVGRPK
ncbi:hypothetical protein ADK76_38275 [Streptomyces griseoflavus]|uniref:DUF7848 domain-containing protein n=1 Tax=Streptomyces rimosus TaxID=1927 RepID=UPI0004C82CC0|nr:hypothetical protein [Streptomyces rimosus]KOG50917.1 hypothetical protein ADK76_38275 [Streptomyces griseoflavus]